MIRQQIMLPGAQPYTAYQVVYGWTRPDYNTYYERVPHFWSYVQ